VHLVAYHLPYGKTHLTFTLPDDLHVQLLAPRNAAGAADPLAAVGGNTISACIGWIGRETTSRPSPTTRRS
ncbi:MAG: hypothetical protein CVU38_20050, partial [Chloroflexi bacterium HGW-Chloroflexi-1]